MVKDKGHDGTIEVSRMSKGYKNGDEYLDDDDKEKIRERQSDSRLSGFTLEQQDILKEYMRLAIMLHDKGESASYEGREMQEKAGDIDTFVNSILDNGEDVGYWQDMQNLSQYPYDICHTDLYNWNGAGKMASMITEFEDKATKWFDGDDEE